MADGAGEVLTMIRREPVERRTRRRFTVDDVYRWQRAGLVDPDARFELIDGEIIDMPAEGAAHKRYKSEVARFFFNAIPGDVVCSVDSTLVLGRHEFVTPDLHFYSADVRAHEELSPQRVLLAIEIADTSLVDDLREKAPKYEKYGVAEYWVIDVNGAETIVFRPDADGRYVREAPVPFLRPLQARHVRHAPLVIADLPRIR